MDNKEIREHFIEVEGYSRHFYLDGAGIVTIGIGCVIHEPSSIQMFRIRDNQEASVVEKYEEYQAIKACPSGMSLGFYRKLATLYMKDEAIDVLFWHKLEDFKIQINREICDTTDYPDQAKIAIWDMAFNLGVDKIKRKFPHFMNAFTAKPPDWHVCALECKRTEDDLSTKKLEGINPKRNEWTRAQFESLEQH